MNFVNYYKKKKKFGNNMKIDLIKETTVNGEKVYYVEQDGIAVPFSMNHNFEEAKIFYDDFVEKLNGKRQRIILETTEI